MDIPYPVSESITTKFIVYKEDKAYVRYIGFEKDGATLLDKMEAVNIAEQYKADIMGITVTLSHIQTRYPLVYGDGS